MCDFLSHTHRIFTWPNMSPSPRQWPCNKNLKHEREQNPHSWSPFSKSRASVPSMLVHQFADPSKIYSLIIKLFFPSPLKMCKIYNILTLKNLEIPAIKYLKYLHASRQAGQGWAGGNQPTNQTNKQTCKLSLEAKMTKLGTS